MAVIQEDITKTTWEMILRFLGTGTEFFYNVLHEGNVALKNGQDFVKELVLAALNKQRERGLPTDQLTQMLDRAEKGEGIHTMDLADEAAAEIATRFAEAGIPCHILDSRNDDTKIVMYMSGDSARVNEIITLWQTELGTVTELDADFFLKSYAVDSFGHIDSVSRVELELFRQEAISNGLVFSYVPTEAEDEYLVLYGVDDKEAAMKAMERVVWALSGEEGNNLRMMLEQDMANKDAIRRALYDTKEDFYIVDGKNPKNYIRSSASSVVYNKGGQVVSRAERNREDFGERASRMAAGLVQPVVMTGREFIAYRALAEKDEALLRGENVVSAFEVAVKTKEAGAPPDLGGSLSTEALVTKIAKEGKVHFFGLSGADSEALAKIAKDHQIKAHVFTEAPDNVRVILDATDAPTLEKVIVSAVSVSPSVAPGLKEKVMEYVSNKEAVYLALENADTSWVVVDANMPNKYIVVGPEGIESHLTGETKTISREDRFFQEQASATVAEITAPVVMSAEDFGALLEIKNNERPEAPLSTEVFDSILAERMAELESGPLCDVPKESFFDTLSFEEECTLRLGVEQVGLFKDLAAKHKLKVNDTFDKGCVTIGTRDAVATKKVFAAILSAEAPEMASLKKSLSMFIDARQLTYQALLNKDRHCMVVAQGHDLKLEVDRKGLMVYVDNRVVERINRKNPQFLAKALQRLKETAAPVVLGEAALSEIEADRKQQVENLSLAKKMLAERTKNIGDTEKIKEAMDKRNARLALIQSKMALDNENTSGFWIFDGGIDFGTGGGYEAREDLDAQMLDELKAAQLDASKYRFTEVRDTENRGLDYYISVAQQRQTTMPPLEREPNREESRAEQK